MDEKEKIEPHGEPPYEHSFFKWGGTNPEWANQAKRLLKHRAQEQDKSNQCTSGSDHCPKL